jgi:hypothetical protein
MTEDRKMAYAIERLDNDLEGRSLECWRHIRAALAAANERASRAERERDEVAKTVDVWINEATCQVRLRNSLASALESQTHIPAGVLIEAHISKLGLAANLTAPPATDEPTAPTSATDNREREGE